MMQPLMTQALANEHIADMRRTAATRSQSVEPAHTSYSFASPLPVRRRAGWWLVGIGLRMAVGSTAHAAR